MSKNITSKQFKEIMTKAGYDFDVWGWGGYLNTISSLLQDSSKLYEIESKFDSAECIKKVGEINKKQAHIIYDELDKVGYYNDYK